MSKTSTIGSAASSMKRKNSIWHALPYIAPHFIIFAVFGIIPIIFGIGLAFTRWNMVGAPKFVGLQNFAKIFDPSTYFYSIFWRDLGHTLLFLLVSVPLVHHHHRCCSPWRSARRDSRALVCSGDLLHRSVSIAAGAGLAYGLQLPVRSAERHLPTPTSTGSARTRTHGSPSSYSCCGPVSAATSSSTVPRSPAWTETSEAAKVDQAGRSGSSSPSPCRKSSCRCSTPTIMTTTGRLQRVGPAVMLTSNNGPNYQTRCC